MNNHNTKEQKDQWINFVVLILLIGLTKCAYDFTYPHNCNQAQSLLRNKESNWEYSKTKYNRREPGITERTLQIAINEIEIAKKKVKEKCDRM